MLVRLGHGHIRIGSFQRAAYERNEDFVRQLSRYCLDTYYGAPEAGDPGVALMERATQACARQAAHMMVAGFVHGVLNSDNINITGGKLRLRPVAIYLRDGEPGFTAAYFDHAGLYSFGRQPEAIHWDLAQLAGCMTLIGDPAQLKTAFDRYPDQYRSAFVAQFLWRLGFAPRGEAADLALVEAAEQALLQSGAVADRFFFDWMGRPGLADPAYAGDEFAAFRAAGGGISAGPHPRSRLLVGGRALLNAHRGGRGDLGAHR